MLSMTVFNNLQTPTGIITFPNPPTYEMGILEDPFYGLPTMGPEALEHAILQTTLPLGYEWTP